MTKVEYLNRLKSFLHYFPESEVREILLDYEEHFIIGKEKGKSEDEISRELGDPREVAESIRSSYSFSNKNDTSYNTSTNKSPNAIILILLIVMNLIFVFGPFMGIVGLLVGFFAAGFGISIGGIGLLLRFPVNFILSTFVPGIVTSTAFGIGLIALGILIVIITILLSKLFYKLCVLYVQWNKKLVYS